MKTIFVIGSKKHTLKYTRKMPEGEVKNEIICDKQRSKIRENV